MSVPVPTYGLPDLPDPLLVDAYRQSASRNVLAALNPRVFFGYFSVCADGIGHGGNNTYPGLDWGQSAEALLWLNRVAEVRASWNYVRSFQREDGLLPLGISPDSAGTTFQILGFPVRCEANGGFYRHWVPGDPFRTLANVTFLHTADAIYRHTFDRAWLRDQMPYLQRAAQWLGTLIEPDGRVGGAGFYLERPMRVEYDGINQCYTAHALRTAEELFALVGDHGFAAESRALSERVTACFRQRFWADDHCVEYIHPQRGAIAHHGLTDVDWAAVATGVAGPEKTAVLWPQLQHNANFLYNGVPTGIATCPETYEVWEFQNIDQHDLAAMGRVWFLEAWARARMGDADGLVASLRRVAQAGRDNDWYWLERYHAPGASGQPRMNTYVEYPANLIRIVQRFLLGVQFELDGSLLLAPTVPDSWWSRGFGQAIVWAGREFAYRFDSGKLTGTLAGSTPQQLRVRLRSAAGSQTHQARVNGQSVPLITEEQVVTLALPAGGCSFEMTLCTGHDD